MWKIKNIKVSNSSIVDYYIDEAVTSVLFNKPKHHIYVDDEAELLSKFKY